MLPHHFSTDRLSMHHWRSHLDDEECRQSLARALRSILSPKVLEPLPPSLQLTDEDDALLTWISNRDAESDVYLINEPQSGTLIGLLILVAEPNEPTIHLGYLLAETAWGKGYATELLNGLVQAAAQDGPVTLIGGVGKDNPASTRVLQKAGFDIDPALSTPNTDMFTRTV